MCLQKGGSVSSLLLLLGAVLESVKSECSQIGDGLSSQRRHQSSRSEEAVLDDGQALQDVISEKQDHWLQINAYTI